MVLDFRWLTVLIVRGNVHRIGTLHSGARKSLTLYVHDLYKTTLILHTGIYLNPFIDTYKYFHSLSG